MKELEKIKEFEEMMKRIKPFLPQKTKQFKMIIIGNASVTAMVF